MLRGSWVPGVAGSTRRLCIPCPILATGYGPLAPALTINKVRLGKWPQAELIALEWNDKLVELDARPLSLEAQDMIAAASLIWEHRDPFDRMISAQAMRRGWALASADHVFKDLHGIALIEC